MKVLVHISPNVRRVCGSRQKAVLACPLARSLGRTLGAAEGLAGGSRQSRPAHVHARPSEESTSCACR